MFERLEAAAAVMEALITDTNDLLRAGPRVQAQFVKQLADNFTNRVMFWQAGLIPQNYTEHGFSEYIIEKGLFLASLPVTLPVCLPAIVISTALDSGLTATSSGWLRSLLTGDAFLQND